MMTASEHRVVHVHFGWEGGQARFLVNLARELHDRGVVQHFIFRPGRTWHGDLAEIGPLILNHNRRLTPSGWLLSAKMRQLVRDWKPTVIMAWGARAASIVPNVEGPWKLARLGDFPRRLKYFRNCDMIVGNMPGIERRALALGWTRPLITITNFPRSLDVVPCSRAQLSTPEDAFVVVSAGRFVECKGFECLIHAVAKLPSVYLWLVGDGPLWKDLERCAATLGIANRVRFPGWAREPMEYFAAADVFVLPSRHEPLGNVILEAWQVGIPVIATRCRGPQWFMSDQIDGLLVDVGDADAIAVAANQIRTSRELAQRLVEGGKSRVETAFSKGRIVEQYMSVFGRKCA